MLSGGSRVLFMRLVVLTVFALGGAQVSVQNVEGAARNLRTPFKHFLFWPMAVEPDGGVG